MLEYEDEGEVWYSDDFEITPPKRRKIGVFAVATLMLVSGIFLKTTLAANINLVTGGPIEFGQGLLAATACDDAITLTPQTSFNNGSGSTGLFKLAGVVLSNLNTTAQGCAGRTLTMNAYGQTGSSLITFALAIASDGTFTSSSGTISNQGSQGANSSVSLTLSSNTAATGVYKISIESSSTILTCATGGSCAVGNTGPGGGIIYYVDNGSGFNCGVTFTSTCHYLEVAPSGWNTGSDPSVPWAISAYQSTAVPGITSRNPVFNDASEIGLGYKYSLAIVAQGNDLTTAAGLSRSYSGGGKTDWYLPTTTELNLLCQWNRGIAQSATTVCAGGTINSGAGASTSGFTGDYYQSSSQATSIMTWVQQFGSANGIGNQGGAMKYANYLLRPIRAF